MSASKKRSAAEFMPKPAPVAEEVAETAPVAEILAETAASVPEVEDTEAVLDPGELVSDPSLVAKLLAEIQGLKKTVGELSKSQARIIEETSDLTDDLWFITRPGGKRSLKKAIIRDAGSGKSKRVMVEDIRTAFIGPFEAEDDVRKYLAEKAKKRSDSVVDWTTCDVMLGRDAREIERREERNFQKAYGDDPEANVNVLERRVRPMFENEASAQKRALGLSRGEGKATQEVALPRVMVKKLADGTETLDIRG